MTEASYQFTKLKDHERVAFEGFMAVYSNFEKHVIIAAPSMEVLEQFWKLATSAELNKQAVQHVHIIQCPAISEAK